MELRKPIATNKIEKPVIIFEDNNELTEQPSIQAAARWLKDYTRYKYMPYKQIENGIFFDGTWNYNGVTFAFTTDVNVKKAKLEEMKEKMQPTGFWTFICNPKKWAIDEFLSSGQEYDTFSIRESDKNNFNIGDLGVIRVGIDHRTKTQLKDKVRLKPGVYAIVKVIDKPKLMRNDNKGFWYETGDATEAKYRVPIQYIRNLLDEPLYIEDIKQLHLEQDKFLINGFQGSSIPLKVETFSGLTQVLENNTSLQEVTAPQKFVEGKTQTIKVNIYERNPLARQKCLDHYGFDCVICGFNFEKVYGEIGRQFIHVHHLQELSSIGNDYEIDPIKDLRPVCPNCHAMLHKSKPAYSIVHLKSLLRG